jgi:hypothetical protein
MEHDPMHDTTASLRDRWSDPLLTALTGLLLFMLFGLAPLQALGLFVFQAFELVLAIVLVVGVFAVSGSRIAAAAMLGALAMITVGAILRIRAPSVLDLNLFAGSWLILGTTLGFVVARATIAAGRITYHRVMGAVLPYLTIAVTFAALFTFLGTLAPKAFSGMSVDDSPALASKLIYFSFATLTTTGYGDIAPVHPLARSLCNLEAIFGQLYPATLLARLVTLELAHREGLAPGSAVKQSGLEFAPCRRQAQRPMAFGADEGQDFRYRRIRALKPPRPVQTLGKGAGAVEQLFIEYPDGGKALAGELAAFHANHIEARETGVLAACQTIRDHVAAHAA